MEQTRAVNKTKGTNIAEHVGVARSMWSRFRGLMGKRGLGEDEALLIDPCSSVHTMFMRFPIDVVYLSKEGRVVKVAAEMGAWRASVGGKGAKRVLEMPAGAAAQVGLEVGDELSFEPRRPRDEY